MKPRAIILLYHRIADTDQDPQLLCVSPRFFEEHLEILNRCYRPIRLRDLGQRLRQGKSFRRCAIITFDDGYTDNLYEAKPLLERHEVPATFFITSGYIGQHHGFWWDELERILLGPSQLPGDLQITINGRAYAWQLGESSQWCEEMRRAHAGWNITCTEVPTPRHEAYRTLHRLLKPLNSRTRSRVLQCLRKAAVVAKEERPAYGVLKPEEVRQSSEGGLVEIGAHTISHPQLSALPINDQRLQIQEGQRFLEEVIGRSVVSFSYPFGLSGDFDNATVDLLRESGFRQACTTLPDLITLQSDPFELPRFIVRNWDGDEFARRLKGLFAT